MGFHYTWFSFLFLRGKKEKKRGTPKFNYKVYVGSILFSQPTWNVLAAASKEVDAASKSLAQFNIMQIRNPKAVPFQVNPDKLQILGPQFEKTHVQNSTWSSTNSTLLILRQVKLEHVFP